MPRAVVDPHVSSVSSVTLLLHGMRPLMPMVARARSSSGSLSDMAVGARTHVALGILGLVTHGADGAAALHELANALDERAGLGARDLEARDGGLLGGVLLL